MQNDYDIKNLIDIFQEHSNKVDLNPNDCAEKFNIAKALHVICKEIEILKENMKKF